MLRRLAQHSAPAPVPLVRGHSRFRLRVYLKGGGVRPYGWEVYDEEDGRSVRQSSRRFRTSAEAWEAGTAMLDSQEQGL